MSYNVIASFKYGLDSRRSELTSIPGTLVELRNGHVNQGGEVEKRKAFVRTLFPLPGGGAGVHQFGLESTLSSLVVFGSRADPGGWPTNVTYQRLMYPLTNAYEMTAILSSTVYDGKVVAVAQYADGKVFLFYNGTAVLDMYTGQIITSFSDDPVIIAAFLALLVNATGLYTATIKAFPNNNTIDVFSLPGNHFSVTIQKTTAAGTMVEQLLNTGTSSSQAVISSGEFQVVAGSTNAANKITQVSVGATNLLTTAVAFNATTEQTAIDVVTAINANSAVSTYRASANSSIVSIYALVAGTTPNGKAVTVTSTGNVCIGKSVFSVAGTGFTLDYVNVNGTNVLTAVLAYPLVPGETLSDFCIRAVANINANTGVSGILSYSTSNVIYLSKTVTASTDTTLNVEVSVSPAVGGTGVVYNGSTVPLFVSVSPTALPFSPIIGPIAGTIYLITPTTTVKVAGGVPPYTYSWPVVVNASGQSSLITVSPSSASTQFRFFGKRGQSVTGQFNAQCTVTDALGNVGVSEKVLMVVPQI